MLYQPAHAEPIRTHGSLFLCYCFIASLQTASQVTDAFSHALSQGWITSQSIVRVPQNVIVDGLCKHFLTPKIERVRAYQVNTKHWVVVNKAGDVLYDPMVPVNNEELDGATLTIHAELYESDLLDKIEEHVGRPLIIRNSTKQTCDGGVWVTGKGDDLLFSAYFHNSRRHCAFVQAASGKMWPGTVEWANPGDWSIAYIISRNQTGNRGLYEVEDVPAAANIFRDYNQRHQMASVENQEATADEETLEMFRNLDPAKIVAKIERARGAPLTNRQVARKIVKGGIWVFGRGDGVIFSALFHKTRRHRALVRPGQFAEVYPKDAQWTKPNKWSYVWVESDAAHGNKALYEIE